MTQNENKIKGILYCVANKKNSKRYIGITTRSLQYRWNGHLRSAAKGFGSKDSLQSAIREFGSNVFECKKLSVHNTLQALSDAEIEAIDQYDTLRPKGYNLNRGGSINFRFDPYELEGITYYSLASIADEYGILQITLQKRMQSGRWTIEQACGLHEPPPDYRRNARAIIVAGTEFRSMLEACRVYKIDKRTVDLRLNRLGWSIDEAFEVIERSKSQIKLNDLVFETRRDACRHFKLNEKMVDSRLRNGWSLEEAFGLKDRQAKPKKFRAISATDRTQSITFKGKLYPSKSKLASAYGIKPATLLYRLRNGWTIGQAVGHENMPQNNPRVNFYKINNEEFSTQELLKNYDVDISTFRARRKRGWNLEQCLGIEPAPSRATVTYIVTTPDGKEIEVSNMKKFAQENNLPANGRELRALATTRRKVHTWKGWKCRKKLQP